MRKITFFFQNLRKRISRVLQKLDIDWGDFGLRIILLLITITLAYNVVIAYQRGIENLQNIQQEEKKLQDLKDKNAQLQDLHDYYSSVEYRRLYARENWNYIEDGEKLYYVDRKPIYEIQDQTITQNPIDLNDNSYWWQRLILGL